MRTVKYQVRAPKGDYVVNSFDDEQKAKAYLFDRRTAETKLRLVRVIVTEHELAV